MSSDEELHDIDESAFGSALVGLDDGNGKRRKVLRACDVCRRKKIRCDAHTKSDARCSHCVTYKHECTFLEGTKKRGPPKGFVEDLQKRIQLLEDLVRRVAPNVDINSEVGPPFTQESWLADKNNQNRRGAGARSLTSSKKPTLTPVSTSPPSNLSPSLPSLSESTPNCKPGFLPKTPYDSNATQKLSKALSASLVPGLHSPEESDGLVASDDEDSYPREDGTMAKYLASTMKRMKLGEFESRFHGKSSGVMLVQAARHLKREVTGNPAPQSPLTGRRERFWRQNPWEWMTANSLPEWIGTVRFPPQDLADNLIALFFRNFAPLYPILHRPTFEAHVKEERFKSDMHFATVYLLVCALASRWSDDPRVCNDRQPDEPIQWQSAGWKFFVQVIALRRPYLALPILTDLQTSALGAIFLQGTSAPHAAWTLSGIGIRSAMDIGAHRRKVYGKDHVFENEMWKRSFWCLVAIDRVTSTALGRPAAIQDDDVDADYPLEVDDEFYNEEKKEWKQPPGKPSRMQYFAAYMKLMQILGFAIRTVYSINKSRLSMGFVGGEWERHIVSELDSASNKWIDALPDHLRWDPNISDPITFEQSALLHLTYHHIQILIHRPFIPTAPKKPSPLSFPSLAICTNAARSASHILEALRNKRCPVMPTHVVVSFTAGVVLLLSLWGVKKTGGTVDVQSQTADIHRCMKFLSYAEERWHIAGRLFDLLSELASVGDLPLPEPSPPEYRKRDREPDEPQVTTPESTRDSARRGPGHSHTPASTFSEDQSMHQTTTPQSDFSGYSSTSGQYSQQRDFDVNPLLGVPEPSGNVLPPFNDGIWNNPAPSHATHSRQPVSHLHPPAEEGPIATFNLNLWNNYHLGGNPVSMPGMDQYGGMMQGLGLGAQGGFDDSFSSTSYVNDLFGGLSAPSAPQPEALMGFSMPGVRSSTQQTQHPPHQPQAQPGPDYWGTSGGLNWPGSRPQGWPSYSMPDNMRP